MKQDHKYAHSYAEENGGKPKAQIESQTVNTMTMAEETTYNFIRNAGKKTTGTCVATL